MPQPPARPQLFHITHVDNLPAIIRSGGLRADAAVTAGGGPVVSIGMGDIKTARLRQPVPCHPGLMVGDCVPFNFCPRSVMLYVIRQANHPNLQYRGGQGPILHLELDLHEVVAWADQTGQQWAFTLSNARAGYTEFRSDLGDLGDLEWHAVRADDFRGRDVKEAKQAEFLVHEFVPWELVKTVGVHSDAIKQRVDATLVGAAHAPRVAIQRRWYF